MLQTIRGTGRQGEVVNVPDGYARNFLLPRGLAQPATAKVIEGLRRERQRLEKDSRREQLKKEELAKSLGRVRVTVAARVNDAGHLFGSITAPDIVNALEKQGYDIPPQAVRIERSLDKVGTYTVPVHLGAGTHASLTVTIVASHGE